MDIALWPLIPRDRLVWAFRPGEPGSSEAPFRTLRKHSWSTAGVRIIPRTSGGRTAGRVTIFSTLNLEAARLARLHDGRSATRVAKAAVAAESSVAFAQVGTLLAELPVHSIAALVQGLFPPQGPDELWEALRRLAKETERRRQTTSAHLPMPEVITGRITQLGPTALVLHVSTGPDITLPRWLAKAAHRETVGACLGLVIDRFEESSAFTYALPAMDLEEDLPRFRPFGQHAPPLALTPADVQLLRREAPPLRVPVPVTIGA
jgi:hypothetical protein